MLDRFFTIIIQIQSPYLIIIPEKKKEERFKQTSPHHQIPTPHRPARSSSQSSTPLRPRRRGRWRWIRHQRMQAEILPRRLPRLLLRTLNPKRSMLVRHEIFFVVRIERLMLRCYEDFFGGELDAREVFEEVGVVRRVPV